MAEQLPLGVRAEQACALCGAVYVLRQRDELGCDALCAPCERRVLAMPQFVIRTHLHRPEPAACSCCEYRSTYYVRPTYPWIARENFPPYRNRDCRHVHPPGSVCCWRHSPFLEVRRVPSVEVAVEHKH